MKKLLSSLLMLLFVGIGSTFAQPAQEYTFQKYYLDVNPTDIPRFLELHKEMTDASMQSDLRTLNGHYVKRHMYAGKASLVLYEVYDSVDDLNADDLWGSIGEYTADMSQEDLEAFSARAAEWWSMWLEGHTDEVRVLQVSGFGDEDFSWQSPGVIINSYYTPKWSDGATFREAYEALDKATEMCGNAAGSRISTHYSGSGTTYEGYVFYNSWDDFAADEKAIQECRQQYVEDLPAVTETYWGVAGEHWDEIYIPVGSYVDGEFKLSAHFTN
ncbi:MAG TPA: hypothetical protein DEF03_03870 [Bacteroidetes bacterium]|nr:hypothetical protein [Bacteroidota bacterium]|tara:strand:- start:1056 stop:1871 length:816 start_codon:yes stop_codon:yes gene_type:complete